LAAEFGLAPRTVTELVDSLERDGLVERRPDPTDRRANVVHLTPTGRDVQQAAWAVRSELLEQVFGTFSDDEKLYLNDVLERVRKQIGSTPGPGCA
jgi:DNA-binding MarR family transcriptional regulator